MKQRLASIFLVFLHLSAAHATAPLRSWAEGDTKRSILDFVQRSTQESSPDFVAPAERIAVFDNDGTLWAEQPLYFQLFFAIDRVKSLAPAHPEWKEQEPFASILAGQVEKALAGGHEAILELVMATHVGVTSEEFAEIVHQWLSEARHPTTGQPYKAMVYQPMLELLDYLREQGYKTFIVSGGGIDFMRVFAEETYGIPPEQVIGSSILAQYELRDGKPVIVKIPELGFIDDKEGKPVGIHLHIGRRPIFAVGNSDGDFQMLEWTTSGRSPSLGVLIHHTDAEREWAYDRNSQIGKLVRGLDEAKERDWLLVDMKRDWKRVFPDETDFEKGLSTTLEQNRDEKDTEEELLLGGIALGLRSLVDQRAAKENEAWHDRGNSL